MLSHGIPSYPTGLPRGAGSLPTTGRHSGSDETIQFMGTHQSRFDAKGRMSVPAPFRAALRSFAVEGVASLILRPSHTLACIDAWPAARFEMLGAGFDKIDLFNENQDDLATTLYADAWPVEPDKEGRIVVPDSLVQHAGLTEFVAFMGLGTRFQIWEPTAALQRKSVARDGAATRRLTVPAAAS